MKKNFAYVLAAIAMLATGAATLGSWWWVHDEPKAFNALCD